MNIEVNAIELNEFVKENSTKIVWNDEIKAKVDNILKIIIIRSLIKR